MDTLIIWSATAYPNKYRIEWINGEFVTSTKHIRTGGIYRNTHDLLNVLAWVNYGLEKDELDMPE